MCKKRLVLQGYTILRLNVEIHDNYNQVNIHEYYKKSCFWGYYGGTKATP